MDTITIDWTDVIGLAPELSAIPTAGQDEILAQCALEVNVSMWGSLARANVAAVWLARHLGSIHGKGGVGIVTEVHAGAVGKSFAQPTADWKSLLSSTRYGMEYLRQVRLRMPRFAVT